MRPAYLLLLASHFSALGQAQFFETHTSFRDSCTIDGSSILCVDDTNKAYNRIFKGCTDGSLVSYYRNGNASSAFISVAQGQDKISLEWFEDGMLKSERVDRGDGHQGYYKEWHPSGLLKLTATLRNQKPDGPMLEWDQHGTLIRDERYSAGTLKRARIKGPKF